MHCSAPDQYQDCPRERYSVILAVQEGEIEAARQTAASLARNTGAAKKLILVGSQKVLAELGQDDSFRAFEPACLQSDSWDSTFVYAVRKAVDFEVLFVRAGALVPEAWDLRLFWTSQRHFGAATVSPMSSPSGALGAGSCEVLDAICYEHSQMNAIPIWPSAACILITPEAAQATVAEWQQRGEEGSLADFLNTTRKLRFRHLLADHVYVDVAGCRGATEPKDETNSIRKPVPQPHYTSGRPPGFSIGRFAAPRQLHVMHSWGGGLNRWVTEYCRADSSRRNYLLKSIGDLHGSGQALALYRNWDDEHPIRTWMLDPWITGTAPRHEGYAAAIQQILAQFGIGQIIVSSLIGHSLDVLRTLRPTLMVFHDYYPFCPALNITFESLCTECDRTRLTECSKWNPHNRFFHLVPPPQWLDLRGEFVKTVQEHSVPLVAPSDSTSKNYTRLVPEFEGRFTIIPHGTRALNPLVSRGRKAGRFRVLILGSLAVNKGLDIIREIQRPLAEFADLYLVGSGSEGKQLLDAPGVTVVDRYQWDQLEGILSGIQPDLAVLPSVVPETFSFTLQELFQLRIPTLATRLGSFADRILEDVNGFLCEPTAAAVLAAIRRLSDDRAALDKVKENLAGVRHRSVAEMLHDYERIMAPPTPSARSYFAPDSREMSRLARSIRCQVSWRLEGQRSAPFHSSVTEYAPKPEWQMVAVSIPSLPKNPNVIRVSPGNAPGLLGLQRLTLRATNGEIIWNWNGDIEAISCRLYRIATIKGKDSVMLGLLEENPHMELPLNDASLSAIGHGGTLEIEIQWYRDGASVEILEAECAKGGRASSLQALLRSLKKNLEDSKGMEVFENPLQHIRMAEERIQELENSLSWKITRPLRALTKDLYPLIRPRSR
jgi:glycosyltransferase involved in cell wall biosynthesis